MVEEITLLWRRKLPSKKQYMVEDFTLARGRIHCQNVEDFTLLVGKISLKQVLMM